jgi:hypothetical protein
MTNEAMSPLSAAATTPSFRFGDISSCSSIMNELMARKCPSDR